MTTTRNALITLSTSFLLASTLAVGCDSEEGEARDVVTQRAAEYSGEELYLGIMFGQGEVASQLPTLWGGGHNEAVGERIVGMDNDRLRDALAEGVERASAQGEDDTAERLAGLIKEIEEAKPSVHDPNEVDYGLLLEAIRANDEGFFDNFAEAIYSGNHVKVQAALQDAREHTKLVWEEIDIAIPGSDKMCVAWLVAVVYEYVAVWEEFWVDDGMFDPETVLGQEMMVDEIAMAFAY